MPKQVEESTPQQAVGEAQELADSLENGMALHLVAESQQVLQGLLEQMPVFQEMEVYYPKTYESILALVTAFENLTVMLQSVGALHDVEIPEEQPEDTQKSDSAASAKSSDGDSQKQAVPVGTIRIAYINGRPYKRVKKEDGWHYINSGEKTAAGQNSATNARFQGFTSNTEQAAKPNTSQ